MHAINASEGEWGMVHGSSKQRSVLRCEGLSHQRGRNDVQRMELTYYLEARWKVVSENWQNAEGVGDDSDDGQLLSRNQRQTAQRPTGPGADMPVSS